MTPPPELSGSYKKMEIEGERNWVLNLQSLAFAAMKSGNFDIAKQALDEAILQIEIIYGDSAQARRARSAFFEESIKIFKGDPYERSMVYFYRGVLYMQDKDWDNARASFRSAQIQDAFVEEQQNQGDWTIFDYLIGVCEVQMGDFDAAQDAFALASRTYTGFGPRYGELNEYKSGVRAISRTRLELQPSVMPFDAKDNLLIITQHGRAPRKVAEGRYGEYQGYRPGGSTDFGARVFVDGMPSTPTQTMDSVYYQAVTRGGREIDRLLGRKAIFKGAGEDVGEVGMMAGAFLLLSGMSDENQGAATVGLAALALGAVSYGIASLVRPEADVRYMHTLPDSLAVCTGRLSRGQHEVRVEYSGAVRATPGNASVSMVINTSDDDINVMLVFPPPQAFAVHPAAQAQWTEQQIVQEMTLQ